MTVWLLENMYLFLSKNIRNYIYIFFFENKNKDKKILFFNALSVLCELVPREFPESSQSLCSAIQFPGIAAYFKIYFSRDFSSVQHVNCTFNLKVLLFLWQWKRPYHFCEKIAQTLTGSQDAIYPLDTSSQLCPVRVFVWCIFSE